MNAEADRPDRVERVPWRAVILYLIIAFALAWGAMLPIWLTGGAGSPHLGLLTVLAVLMMFTPALATLVVVFFVRVPRVKRLRFLGMWPLRPAKCVVWFMVGAVFAPIAVVLAIVAVAVLLGLVDLDLVGFSGYAAMLDEQLAQLPADAAALARSSMPPMGVLVAIQLASLPVAALINSVVAFGEELGWRGWLLPALRPLGVWPALVISGIVWGLWHTPIILLGYNFGLTDWRGVALMVGGCVAWGVLLGWARLRSASVWPAVIGHGSLNAVGGLVVLLAAAGTAPDIAVVGPLGLVAWAVIAVSVVPLVLSGQFAREPVLAAPKRRRTRSPGKIHDT